MGRFRVTVEPADQPPQPRVAALMAGAKPFRPRVPDDRVGTGDPQDAQSAASMSDSPQGPSEKKASLSAQDRYLLLLEIFQQIAGTLELDEILSHLLDAVRKVLDYDAAGIFVLNEQPIIPAPVVEENLIAGAALRGFDDRNAQRDPMFRSGKGIIGHIIRTGASVVVEDVRQNEHYVEGRQATRSEIAVPIVLNKTVIGALNLESDRLGAYTASDLELLHFFANAAGLSIEKAMLHRQLVEKKRLEGELEIARRVQSSLLPVRPPDLPGFETASINIPTYYVGGDYFDFIPSPGRMGFAIADVSGKGAPAALIMATFRAALRTQLSSDPDAVRAMVAVNRLLMESLSPSEFVTAVYGVLDLESALFLYVNCGHNPPLLLAADGAIQSLSSGGPALGILEQSTFAAGQARLEPGGVLVLYTDGVIETMDPAEREFGNERFETLLRSCRRLPAQQIVNRVVEATCEFLQGRTYADDFTLVVLKRTGSP